MHDSGFSESARFLSTKQFPVTTVVAKVILLLLALVKDKIIFQRLLEELWIIPNTERIIRVQTSELTDKYKTTTPQGWGVVLPYISHIGMCGPKGYGF